MKKKIIIIAVIAVLIVAAAVTAIVIVKNNEKKDPKNYKETLSDEIKIPGYMEFNVSAGQTDASITLENPEGNPCYFVYEFVLKETEEVIFTSAKIAPGTKVDEIKLAKALDAGTYPITVKITTSSIADGSAMNGATMEAVIYSK